MKSIGIDIGSSSIKIAELSLSSKGVSIERLLERNLNSDPSHDSELDILEYLRAFGKEQDLSKLNLTLGIKQSLISGRRKIFPFKEKQKILRSLPFELEEDIPFSQDKAIFDAKVIQTQGSLAEVYACSCPKEQVQNTLDFCQDINAIPHSLSADGLSLGNLVEDWPSPPQQGTIRGTSDLADGQDDTQAHEPPQRNIKAILNIGHRRSLVVFYDQDTRSPISAKSILWGGVQIIEALCKAYEIPYVEAAKEARTNSFLLLSDEGATSDQITFSEVLSRAMKELGRSLRLIIMDTQSEFQGKVRSLSFTGGASQVRNLGPYLTQQLEIPCNRFKYLNQFKQLPANIKPSPEVEARFSQALALAIEGLKTPRNPGVNFLKGEFTQQNQAFKLFWDKWKPALVFGSTLIALLFIYGVARQSVTSSLDTAIHDDLKAKAKSIAKLSARRSSPSKVKKFINDKKASAKKVEQIQALLQMPSALDILKIINDGLPAKNQVQVDITHLEIKDNDIAIQGQARRRDLPRIRKSLEKISSNGKIKNFRSFAKSSENKIPFAFKFKYNRKKKKL